MSGLALSKNEVHFLVTKSAPGQNRQVFHCPQTFTASRACNQKHFLHFHNLFSLSEQHSEQDKRKAWQVLLFCFAKSWWRREIEGPVSTFVTSGLFSWALNLQRCLEAARIMPTFKILISNSTFHLVQLICQKGKGKEWMRIIKAVQY